MTRRSSDIYATAFAMLDAAHAQSRIEQATSEARVAQLKLAAELEKQGRMKEAEKVVARVAREQDRLG